jgi:hypothetical protein
LRLAPTQLADRRQGVRNAPVRDNVARWPDQQAANLAGVERDFRPGAANVFERTGARRKDDGQKQRGYFATDGHDMRFSHWHSPLVRTEAE